MTQNKMARCWIELLRLMEDDAKSVVLADIANNRRVFWSNGEWHTNAADRPGGSFTTELYRGSDPLAALKAFTK